MESLVVKFGIHRIIYLPYKSFHGSLIPWFAYTAGFQRSVIIGSLLNGGIIEYRFVAVMLPDPLPHVVTIGLTGSSSVEAEGI